MQGINYSIITILVVSPTHNMVFLIWILLTNQNFLFWFDFIFDKTLCHFQLVKKVTIFS